MAKHTLLVVSLIALVHPSVQLNCYQCVEDDYPSAYKMAHLLPLCRFDPLDEYEAVLVPEPNLVCKKVLEKVTRNGNTTVHTINMINREDQGLDPTIFTELSCETDLCNSEKLEIISKSKNSDSAKVDSKFLRADVEITTLDCWDGNTAKSKSSKSSGVAILAILLFLAAIISSC